MKTPILTLSVALLMLSSGCGSCGKEEAVVTASQPSSGNLGGTAYRNQESKGAGKRTNIKDMDREGLLLMVEFADGSARVWSEGARKSNQYPLANVRFSPAGFEFERAGLTMVTGTGGGIYTRMGTHSHELRPLSEFSDGAGEPPTQYEVDWSVAKSGLIQVQLIPDGFEEVSLGKSHKAAPIGVHWMVGELPAGQPSAPLHGVDDSGNEVMKLAWPTEDGEPLSQLPESCEDITGDYQPENESIWVSDIGQIRSGEVSIDQAIMVDLDRDGQTEAVVCVSGGTGEENCFVVDTVGDERRYFGLNLGAKGDAPLMAFAVLDGHYISWVGRINRSTRETDKDKLFIVRFDGGGYVTELQP